MQVLSVGGCLLGDIHPTGRGSLLTEFKCYSHLVTPSLTHPKTVFILGTGDSLKFSHKMNHYIKKEEVGRDICLFVEST